MTIRSGPQLTSVVVDDEFRAQRSRATRKVEKCFVDTIYHRPSQLSVVVDDEFEQIGKGLRKGPSCLAARTAKRTR